MPLLLALAVHASVGSTPAYADGPEYVDRVVQLSNVERQKAGLQPLVKNMQLAIAAQQYAELLAGSYCIGHECGPVPDIAGRDERAGYVNWTAVGENIAAGQPTPETLVQEWMSSPEHRSLLLNPAYSEIGVGFSAGRGTFGNYWTQELGARGAPAPDPASDDDSGD